MDALGNPVHFLLTGGNIFDASVAVDLLSEVKISGSNILGDKAYGTNSIRTYITEQRASYTIPPKSNVIEPWFCDFHTYKERHLILFLNKMISSFYLSRFTADRLGGGKKCIDFVF